MSFRTPLTVRFGDVDPAGIVYYPRFLHYCHLAMEEFFAAGLGHPYPQVLAEERFGFPTVHLEADFRRPLRYGDEIEVEVEVVELGRTSATWRFRVFRRGGDEALAEARVVTAGIDLDSFRPRAAPAWFLEGVARWRRQAGDGRPPAGAGAETAGEEAPP